MRLDAISAALNTQLAGDGATEITGVAGIEEATTGQITFVANPKYSYAARTTKAAAVIVSENFPTLDLPTLRSKNPYFAFAKAIELFYNPPQYAPGIHPTAVVDASASIESGAHLGPYVVVGKDVRIGKNCILLAHVVIYEGAKIGGHFFAHAHAVVREHCEIGDHVILQNGVILGGDGFGFAKDNTGSWHKILQSGRTTVGDHVEIQANACIDRASVGATRIAAGAKVDNLVQVGHGSSVGRNTLLCSQVGLAGSTEIGDEVILAGQVGVAGHLKVGDRVVATAQTGIPSNVEADRIISGYPAIDNKQWLRAVAVFGKLPELAKAIRGAKSAQNEDVPEK